LPSLTYLTSAGFTIGGWTIVNNRKFNGFLSNISVWNTALTDGGVSVGSIAGGQIAELYNNGTPSNLSSHSATSNLVSWWKLNNTTTGIEDAKGSNNGTNNGTTEYPGFVSKTAGESSGMSQANLVQSNLQTVAPYSKYAMNFDGANDYITLSPSVLLPNQHTISAWIKSNDLTSSAVGYDLTSSAVGYLFTTEGAIKGIGLDEGSGPSGVGKFYYWNGSVNVVSTTAITVNNWHHIVFVFDSTANEIKFYLDGNLDKTTTVTIGTAGSIKTIGSYNETLHYLNGSLSNFSIWNIDLTSAQVSEIYNEGLPSNLNSHSAYSNLVSWWQLGENSSFDGSDWIVADEKGSNNGTSTGMPVGALVNGVGTTANGVSSGMSEGNLVGDAPYSTANAISSGMAVQAFDSANPPNVISGRSEDVPS